MSSGSIAAKGRRAGKSPWVERFGRAGLVAKGALYAVVAILAIDVALGGRKESPDKNGALRTIAEQPFGKVLLTAARSRSRRGTRSGSCRSAILDRENEGEDAKGLAKRATALARAGWYGVLCWLTVSTLVGNGSGNSNEQQKTAGIFDHPGGRYLVYAAGFAFLGAAAFNGYRAITCKFNKKLKQEEMSEAEEAAATGVGILGHLARCAVFGLIGIFLFKSRLGVRLQGGERPRRRAARARPAAVRRAPPGGGRRRPVRLRALLLRAGALPPYLDLPWKSTTF